MDDPYEFGAIAAANAMSDVYAMGGEVLFAMNLVAFPDTLDGAILAEILRGGAEKVAEAGAIVVGGHSVTDKEPKYGLAVTGLIDPSQVIRKGGARPGDILLLTKPLGVGVITTALKQQTADSSDVAAAVAAMSRLNRAASRAALAAGAHAMTDITGFGLLGHAREMVAQGDEVDFQFNLGALPFLPGIVAYAKAGAFPAGMANNRNYFSKWVRMAEEIDNLWQDLLYTPETSGGLLIAINPDQLSAFGSQFDNAQAVGEVKSGDGRIYVER